MAKQRFVPIFERSLAEQQELVLPQIARIQQENLNRGLYNSYRDKEFDSKDIVVRIYANRREVVQIDAASGQTKTVKVIR
ncbi:hypothetical protein [Mucilaginibacter sp. PAMB04168]|uniref:hypothetical protein n=1 Tax=Mucilaginibacter sp. PAMB04168 TaxID=3138567 RepID=UPI0031F6433B